MRLGIMQPYFLPYIGYFQLIAAVDVFLVYDNIQYTKKGWINRNRFLQNGSDTIFSLPLKKGSDFLDVVQREISEEFNREKFLNQLKGAYARAPYFEETYEVLKYVVGYEDRNLFQFVNHSIATICQHIGINTKLSVSSDVSIDHELKSQDKVIAICNKLGAKTYINTIGGLDLYDRKAFDGCGIDLKFIKSKTFEYKQYDNSFVPWLSIVDVLMFNPRDAVHEAAVNNYELI